MDSWQDRLEAIRASSWQAGDGDYLRLIKPLCTLLRGRTCVDVGALVGLYASQMAEHAAHTLCYEPLPDARAVLTQTLSGYAGRVTIRDCALSDKKGEAQLSFPICGQTPVKQWASIEKNFTQLAADFPGTIDGVASMTVPLRMLDDELAELQLPKIGYLKIDAEGAEEAILRGAQKTLMRDRPFVVCELEERHVPGCTQRMPEFMNTLNYDVYFILGSVMYKAETFDASVLQKGPAVPQFAMPEVEFSKPYIQMFMGVPREDKAMLELVRTSLRGGL
jgi:FkbM family methyltransferase